MTKKLIIFFHGYGANGADLKSLAPFFQDIADDVRVESPDALEKVPNHPGGCQWFPLESMDPAYLKTQCHKVVEKVTKMVDRIQTQHKVGPQDTFFIGFSQGTMMALYCALSHPHLCKGVVGFSGGLYMDAHNIKANSNLQVALIHGQEDTVVTPQASVDTSNFLKKHGFKVDLNLLKGLGHGIDPNGISFAEEFLRNLII